MPLGSTWSEARIGCVRDDIAGDLSQPALLTDRDGGLVEGHAAADGHEVALAGRCCLLRRVEQRRVAVVDDDLAPVDAPGGVAPVCERSGLLDELHLESRMDGVGGVVEYGDVDGLIAHTADGGCTAGSRFAYFADPGPVAVGGGARRQSPTRRGSGRGRHCHECLRRNWWPRPSAAPTFEACLIQCRTSSHPPRVIGSFNYDPNRSGGAAHTLGGASPKCMVAPPPKCPERAAPG